MKLHYDDNHEADTDEYIANVIILYSLKTKVVCTAVETALMCFTVKMSFTINYRKLSLPRGKNVVI